MSLSRINERIDAAVRRASARYSSASFVFVAPNGTKVPLEAVKKDADVDALAPISGVAAARRFEFVVTRRAFDAVAAVLSGAVAGDHASPISDTTILASAGAQCHHIDHVSTQLPYVLLVVMCSFVGYIVDGFTNNGFAGLAVGIVMLAIVCLFIRAKVPAVEIDNPQD